jgi:6-bladed beta-propeller protein
MASPTVDGLTLNGRIRRLAIVLAVTTACGEGKGREAGWRGTMDTLPNGAIVVSNPAEGVWDSATAWRLVEDLRIGPADDGPASFSFIPDLEIDPSGRIYVLDQGSQEIRSFDATGRYIRRIGRKGAGPSEFRQAIGLDWDPRGRLWVVDQENVRYTILDTLGSVLDTRTRPFSGWYTTSWRGGIDAMGRVHESYPTPGSFTSLVLLRLDSNQLRADTFALPSHEGEVFRYERGGMRLQANVPFTPSLRWVFDSRGFVWFGLSAPYRIYQRRIEGDTVRIIERAYQPLPVTAAERDSAIAAMDWFTRQGGKVDASRVASQKPAYERILVDDAGRLWVAPVAAGAEAGKVLDVFDPEGRYLGRVNVPFRLGQVLIIRGDVVYAATEDDDGAPFVVRARILRPR